MSDEDQIIDAVVVGAGFAGMYMTHLLRQSGMRVQGFERGRDVGGTWYWNRYPGCRCDVESMEYSYQFSEDLEQEWEWTERYAPQPEILAYANHVADRFRIRDNFKFETAVIAAAFQDTDKSWRVKTDRGDHVSARFLIMATGNLSAANMPNIPGSDEFKGATYHTGAWPHDGVDFSGKRVAVIGTGSSGIQSIPFIAQQAAHLTVFQRTANFSVPAQNRPLDPKDAQRIKGNYQELRARNYQQAAAFGAEYEHNMDSVLDASPEERTQRFEKYWGYGGLLFMGAFADISTNLDANKFAADFVRAKIRSIVKDPATAELLCPTTVIGCKRICADTGYFDTYNRPNVELVDISDKPIERITKTGLTANGRGHELDAIVFATGFDAMTGALLNCNVSGKNNIPLKDKWADGPNSYLGLMTQGFPNFFMITGPGSPSVLANMVTGVEQHSEFIARFISHARENQIEQIEAGAEVEKEWGDVVNMRGDLTLYPQCNSWYLGANIPGKPRVFMPYVGFPDYTTALREVESNGYKGFILG
jgi:cyclohexanone monooxygenase